jgi:hypothetical protein
LFLRVHAASLLSSVSQAEGVLLLKDARSALTQLERRELVLAASAPAERRNDDDDDARRQ